MIAERDLGVEMGWKTSRQTYGLPIAAQPLDRRLAAPFAVVVEVKIIICATHALLDVEELADGALCRHTAEGVGAPPVRFGDPKLDLAAHGGDLSEDQLQLGADLLEALALRQDNQGVKVQVADAAFAATRVFR